MTNPWCQLRLTTYSSSSSCTTPSGRLYRILVDAMLGRQTGCRPSYHSSGEKLGTQTMLLCRYVLGCMQICSVISSDPCTISAVSSFTHAQSHGIQNGCCFTAHHCCATLASGRCSKISHSFLATACIPKSLIKELHMSLSQTI